MRKPAQVRIGPGIPGSIVITIPSSRGPFLSTWLDSCKSGKRIVNISSLTLRTRKLPTDANRMPNKVWVQRIHRACAKRKAEAYAFELLAHQIAGLHMDLHERHPRCLGAKSNELFLHCQEGVIKRRWFRRECPIGRESASWWLM